MTSRLLQNQEFLKGSKEGSKKKNAEKDGLHA